MKWYALPSICALGLLSSTTYAQQNEKGAGMGIEANVSAGKIIKHTKKFLGPVPPVTTSYEVNFVQKTWGNKGWHQRRKYPVLGFGLTVTNYGLDSVYGNCISIYPNVELPIIRGKKIEWTFRAAFGLGYMTRRYQRTPSLDTMNNAIGSRFNNYTVFNTDVRYHVNEHWDVQVGGNFSHVSNAALRQPNLGINMYGAHIGVRYFPVTSTPARIFREQEPLKNRWLLQTRLGISATEAGKANGPLYPVYMASVYGSKRYRSKSKFFVGTDYSYHEFIYSFLRNNEILPGKERANSWRGSIFVGNEFLLGRAGILLQLGYYYKEPYLKLDKIYQKLGGNYYLVQNEEGALKELFLSILLKTHRVQAELVEIGVGAGF